jgi:hypothetical protein
MTAIVFQQGWGARCNHPDAAPIEGELHWSKCPRCGTRLFRPEVHKAEKRGDGPLLKIIVPKEED